MDSQEKYSKIKNLFDQQKDVLSKITIENYFDSAIKIRKLEFQKAIIKAIPKKTAN